MKIVEMASPIIGEDEIQAAVQVLRSGILTQGTQVPIFEENFRKLVGSEFACAVNSGTSGLHAGLLASGLGPGDEVIVPSFTFAASANSIALTGATPVFIDVDIDTFCLDTSNLRELITDRTRGVMAVHLYGNPANMTEIMEVAKEKNLQVYEDAAQAHGAKHNGKSVGTFGEFGVFSFYPTKNITAIEAGLIVTSNQGLDRKIRLLRNQGMIEKYVHEVVGLNYRLSEVHAAVGAIQVSRLTEFNSSRKKFAKIYDSELKNVITPYTPNENEHVYHQYTIRIPDQSRDEVAKELLNRGIRTAVYYPTPTHRQPAYNLKLELPNTDRLSNEVLSLPIHPNLTEEHQSYVIESLNKIMSAGS